jgi:putative transposase
MMCRVLNVSKSGYYAWRTRPESVRAKTDRELTRLIRRYHADSGGVYGSPKIRADLHDEGFKVGRNRVARLMREAGLRGCPKRRFRVKSAKAAGHLVSSNLLAQNFRAEQANERWASDITYIHTTQGWLFLAIVMDLYSRKIVGWSMDRNMSRYLVIDALRMAIGRRQPAEGLVHHSDRGPQYTSDEFLAELKQHGMTPSMSGSGNCYDNAVVESFFGVLKRERVNRVSYRTRAEAQSDVFEYIEVFYNRKRRHGYLGNISPAAFEKWAYGLYETVH